MSEYFPDFPSPANMDYYHRSDIEKWAKRHRVEWDMLYSQIDRVFEQRDKLSATINKLRDQLENVKNGKLNGR